MNQDKSEAVDFIFREMLIKGVTIEDLCKRWGGEFISKKGAIVSRTLPFDVLYQSGAVCSYKAFGDVPIAVCVKNCFVALCDLPQKLSFPKALQETALVKFNNNSANMGVLKIWDFLFENAEAINNELTLLGGQKIDFSSAYWIYSHLRGKRVLYFENGVTRFAPRCEKLNVRPMCLLP